MVATLAVYGLGLGHQRHPKGLLSPNALCRTQRQEDRAAWPGCGPRRARGRPAPASHAGELSPASAEATSREVLCRQRHRPLQLMRSWVKGWTLLAAA